MDKNKLKAYLRAHKGSLTPTQQAKLRAHAANKGPGGGNSGNGQGNGGGPGTNPGTAAGSPSENEGKGPGYSITDIFGPGAKMEDFGFTNKGTYSVPSSYKPGSYAYNNYLYLIGQGPKPPKPTTNTKPSVPNPVSGTKPPPIGPPTGPPITTGDPPQAGKLNPEKLRHAYKSAFQASIGGSFKGVKTGIGRDTHGPPIQRGGGGTVTGHRYRPGPVHHTLPALRYPGPGGHQKPGTGLVKGEGVGHQQTAGPGMISQAGRGGTPQSLGRGSFALGGHQQSGEPSKQGGARAERLRKLRHKAGISRAELKANPKLNAAAGALGLRGKGDSHKRDFSDVQSLIDKIRKSDLNPKGHGYEKQRISGGGLEQGKPGHRHHKGPFRKHGHGGSRHAKDNLTATYGVPGLSSSQKRHGHGGSRRAKATSVFGGGYRRHRKPRPTPGGPGSPGPGMHWA